MSEGCTPYRAFDEASRERRITASYQSDPLGLRLRLLAELDDATGGLAAIYPANAANRPQ